MKIFPLKTGDFVKSSDFNAWYVVTYPYGEDGEEIFSACGLGKAGSFPVLSSEIVEKRQFISLLGEFHKEDILFWMSVNGRLFVSYPMFNTVDNIIYTTGPNVYFKEEIVRGMHGKILFEDSIDCGFTYQFDKLILLGKNSTIKIPTENKKYENFFPSIRSYVEDTLFSMMNRMKFPLTNLEEHEFCSKDKVNEADIDLSSVYYTIK